MPWKPCHAMKTVNTSKCSRTKFVWNRSIPSGEIGSEIQISPFKHLSFLCRQSFPNTMIRNNGCGILLYARSTTIEWCRLHWRSIRKFQPLCRYRKNSRQIVLPALWRGVLVNASA
jgi:hypothetical protein